MKLFKSSIYAITFLIFGASAADAALLAYDPFAYPVGSLTGQNGGSGFSGAYTATNAGIVVTSPGSTYPGVPTSGNKASFSGGPNNGALRTFTSSPDAVGTTIYFSYLMQITNPNGSYAGVSLFNGGTETLFTGMIFGQTTFGIDPKGGTLASSASTVANLSLLVYRIDFLASSATIRLYVNPDVAAGEPIVADATATKTSALLFDGFRMQSGSAAGSVDEFRLGTTFADVAVPEPSSTAMLVFGMTVLMTIRRRK